MMLGTGRYKDPWESIVSISQEQAEMAAWEAVVKKRDSLMMTDENHSEKTLAAESGPIRVTATRPQRSHCRMNPTPRKGHRDHLLTTWVYCGNGNWQRPASRVTPASETTQYDDDG